MVFPRQRIACWPRCCHYHYSLAVVHHRVAANAAWALWLVPFGWSQGYVSRYSVKGCQWISEVGVQLAALSQWGGVCDECSGWLQFIADFLLGDEPSKSRPTLF